jgi:hypothetical protein
MGIANFFSFAFYRSQIRGAADWTRPPMWLAGSQPARAGPNEERKIEHNAIHPPKCICPDDQPEKQNATLASHTIHTPKRRSVWVTNKAKNVNCQSFRMLQAGSFALGLRQATPTSPHGPVPRTPEIGSMTPWIQKQACVTAIPLLQFRPSNKARSARPSARHGDWLVLFVSQRHVEPCRRLFPSSAIAVHPTRAR